MSNRAKNLLFRFLDRVMDGPKCPNCGHDAAIHDDYVPGEDKCLGAIYDKGTHVRWCDCTSLRKKPKEKES